MFCYLFNTSVSVEARDGLVQQHAHPVGSAHTAMITTVRCIFFYLILQKLELDVCIVPSNPWGHNSTNNDNDNNNHPRYHSFQYSRQLVIVKWRLSVWYCDCRTDRFDVAPRQPLDPRRRSAQLPQIPSICRVRKARSRCYGRLHYGCPIRTD